MIKNQKWALTQSNIKGLITRNHLFMWNCLFLLTGSLCFNLLICQQHIVFYQHLLCFLWEISTCDETTCQINVVEKTYSVSLWHVGADAKTSTSVLVKWSKCTKLRVKMLHGVHLRVMVCSLEIGQSDATRGQGKQLHPTYWITEFSLFTRNHWHVAAEWGLPAKCEAILCSALA